MPVGAVDDAHTSAVTGKPLCPWRHNRCTVLYVPEQRHVCRHVDLSCAGAALACVACQLWCGFISWTTINRICVIKHTLSVVPAGTLQRYRRDLSSPAVQALLTIFIVGVGVAEAIVAYAVARENGRYAGPFDAPIATLLTNVPRWAVNNWRCVCIDQAYSLACA